MGVAAEFVLKFCAGLSMLMVFLSAHKAVYMAVGLFRTRVFPPAENFHKYAVVIAARNEEKVIGNLIWSIKRQDYPAEYVTVFVVADNCTDKTAEISRSLGALCYERYDLEHRTKGYALEHLFDCIARDYSIEAFEGYFIFDSDNLLKSDYISRMNDSFDAGEKIITSYRNTKNLATNWVSFSYGMHWLRTIRYEHRARSVLKLATRIQGTGFLFANELVKNGWHYTSLTEDRAFSADSVVSGYRISYNNAAEFYDEQPVSLRIALRQRLRWSKGHLQAFAESGGKLFANVFRKKSFMSYDMLATIFPKAVFGSVEKLLSFIASVLILTVSSGLIPGTRGLLLGLLASFTKSYLRLIFDAVYILVIERKHVEYMPLYKKTLYIIAWPMFDVIGSFAILIALFKRVEWRPIPHTESVSIETLQARMSKCGSRGSQGAEMGLGLTLKNKKHALP